MINDDYDGTDINVNCGSTHLGPLTELMAECGADVGIAHDGDADRVMLMAKDGTEIDGDIVEAVLAVDLKNRGELPHNTAVSTVMTNLGFVRAMEAHGIDVLQTKGDGLVTACQFLAAVRRSGKPVEEAIKVMTKFPQTLINVRVKDKHALEGNAPIWNAVHAAEAEMGDTGRVLVRTSGTEPLVRVMVEAETQESADAHAKVIAEAVERELA